MSAAHESPIGGLILTATKAAKRKANGHTSVAPCGCEVRVAFFSPKSSTVAISRCVDHPVRYPAKR